MSRELDQTIKGLVAELAASRQRVTETASDGAAFARLRAALIHVGKRLRLLGRLVRSLAPAGNARPSTQQTVAPTRITLPSRLLLPGLRGAGAGGGGPGARAIGRGPIQTARVRRDGRTESPTLRVVRPWVASAAAWAASMRIPTQLARHRLAPSPSEAGAEIAEGPCRSPDGR